MDVGPVMAAWNAAVGLHLPTLVQLERATSAGSRRPLFDWESGRVFLGRNLVAVLPVGTEIRDDAPVISVQLVCRPGYYTGSMADEFESIPPFDIAGQLVPCSAQTMLEHLKRRAPDTAVELQGTPDEWDLYFGRALGFHFPRTAPEMDDPSDASLHVVEFNYSLRYDAPVPPTISSAGTRSPRALHRE